VQAGTEEAAAEPEDANAAELIPRPATTAAAPIAIIRLAAPDNRFMAICP
jgi:hypothetical protein